MRAAPGFLLAVAAASTLAGAVPADAHDVGRTAAATAPRTPGWTRTYVIEWYEPAMYYGAKSGTIEPGTDCPAGAAAAPDWVKTMTDAGYTKKEAEWLRDPANPTRSPINGQPMMAFRGKDRANVYDFPWTTPEVGLPPVTGRIAEGIDLDDDARTGFASPLGEPGIDNNFYKALGCWKTYRGPHRMSSGAQGSNDSMLEGAWTVVVVVSGEGADPRNDKDVRVGLYMSDDKIVRDGMGQVAKDYTFKIKPDPMYEAVYTGSVKDGRITGRAVGPVWIRNPGYDRDLQLLKSKIDLSMKEDGSLTGLVGGYRPWLPVYKGWVSGRGPVIEALTWVRLPDVYYALKRYADYSPSGPGGEKTYISYALRIDAAPAFVMEPDASRQVAGVRSYRTPAGPPARLTAGGRPVRSMTASATRKGGLFD